MSSDIPVFSVITPTFNRRDKIYRVYESLVSQSFKNFEWVVVDDGSTDCTDELVSVYQKEATFPIIYVPKSNGGKTSAVIMGVGYARGELVLVADSDDAFVPETLELFYGEWSRLDDCQKSRCNGVYALCINQHGNPIGADYRSEGRFDPMEFTFGDEIKHVGENWFAINASMMKKHWTLREDELALGFIPESHFWNKIIVCERPFGLRLNRRLRVYYTNEDEPSLSVGIRKKAARGFCFESEFVLNTYGGLLYRYPRFSIKHLLKYILFVQYLKHGFLRGLSSLKNPLVKFIFIIVYPIGFVLHRQYFG